MDEFAINIQLLINESNKHFSNNKFDKAAAKAETAFSLVNNNQNCPDIAKKRIQFNLATIYTALSKYELAKEWLDLIQNDSFTFFKLKEIAVLYSKIGLNLKNDKNKFRKSLECFQLSAKNYAKCNLWLDYCLISLAHAKLLVDFKMFRECFQIVNKILTASMNLNEPNDLIQIYNDLSTIYAKDMYNSENVKYAKKLLIKSLNILKSNDIIDLEVYIYQNLSAVYNQLEIYEKSIKYIDQSYLIIKDTDKYSHVLSDLKFNEGYARFKSDQVNEAINCFTQSHQFALKTNQKNVWESLESLATIYYSINYYDEAFEFYEKALECYNQLCKLKKVDKNLNIENRLFYKQKETSNQMRDSNANNLNKEKNEEKSIYNTNMDLSTIKSTNHKIVVQEMSLIKEELNENHDNVQLNEKNEENKEINNINNSNVQEVTVDEINKDDNQNEEKILESSNYNNNQLEIEDDNNQLLNTDKLLQEYKEQVELQDKENVINEIIKETETTLNEINHVKNDQDLVTTNTFTKRYKSFNNGSVVNHPEDKNETSKINQKNKKSSKICTIS